MKISTLSLITAVAISVGTLGASAHLGLGHGSSAHSNSPQTKKPTQPSGSTHQNTAANRIAQNPALAARRHPIPARRHRVAAAGLARFLPGSPGTATRPGSRSACRGAGTSHTKGTSSTCGIRVAAGSC